MIIMYRTPIRMLLFCFSLIFSTGEIFAQQNYQNIVDKMLEDYPESTLQDIYKSFFQDRFGPGHLITNTSAAREYLHHELNEMAKTVIPYYEPAGAGENYYRVNLAVIKDGIITENDFFNAFIESAAKVKFPTVEKWAEEWAEILKTVPTDIENYHADKAMIDSVLTEGKYAIHHSRRFNEAYCPHYRLIDKTIFESKLLPLILSYSR